jgi:hypothetical protein
MPSVARLVALLAVIALSWQSVGVVNAFEYDPRAHCCCGDHDASDPCGCPECPGAGRLRWREPAAGHGAPAAPAVRPCHVRGKNGLVTPPPSLPPPPSPTLAAPLAVGRQRLAEAPPLAGRVPPVIVPPS